MAKEIGSGMRDDHEARGGDAKRRVGDELLLNRREQRFSIQLQEFLNSFPVPSVPSCLKLTLQNI
jgi:hypothetical protein